MPVAAHILQQAAQLYLKMAYSATPIPAEVRARMAPVMALRPDEVVPTSLLEKDAANAVPTYALRLGQPVYPFMKLVLEPVPASEVPFPHKYLLRADAHDRHLHAPEGSPDAAWLASIRNSNQELVERIEGAWAQAGLPTFKQFLRAQLQYRKAQKEARDLGSKPL